MGDTMTIQLPELPYAKDALTPHISAETLDFHHGKHHNAYVTKLNAAIEGTDLAGKDLVEIVRASEGGTFNNAAQVWNHTFYWHSLSPTGGGEPTGAIKDAIDKKFGSFDEFKIAFAAAAVGNFASGWTWLVKDAAGELAIVNTDDAETPITDAAVTPILTLDVWEHAYYIDYRNVRPDYISAYWHLVNWDFANANL
ncbi:MAG: Fe-Mn family superoxide dismutase [Candidatus Azotimanducaceae bacterium]|jgi:Fe-Mn family superoxide dismutase